MTLKTSLILQSSASNKTRSHFATDAYRIQRHGITAVSMHAIDTASSDGSKVPNGPHKGRLIKDQAHRDFWQLIAPTNKHCKDKGLHNQQYALAKLLNPVIINSTMYSEGLAQGVFCSDGVVLGARIQGCSITTNSQHYITLNGAVDPIFSDNFDQNGEPVPIVLNNARLAGGFNIWILSFKNNDYKQVTADNLTDNRGKKHRKADIHLKNFDLKAFRYEVENNLSYPKGKDSTIKYCQSLKDLALRIGVKA